MTNLLHATPQFRAARYQALDCQHGSLTLQIPEEKSKDGSWVQKGSKPVLALSHQQVWQAQPHRPQWGKQHFGFSQQCAWGAVMYRWKLQRGNRIMDPASSSCSSDGDA
jgi:hypothetical protein